MRQIKDKTLLPRFLPSAYQNISLSSAAQTPRPMQRNRFNSPVPARAPMVIKRGTLGKGSPSVSARIQKNSKV